MQDGRSDGAAAGHPLTPQIAQAIADAMAHREQAEAVLAWAAGHPSPADPEGLREHAAHVRAWSQVVGQTAQTHSTEPDHLSFAVTRMIGAERAVVHCMAKGPWKQAKPRPSLKGAWETHRIVTRFLAAVAERRAAQPGESQGSA